ncbi:MAG TPA: helix-turn-helix domain-containing protein [Acidimicrobiales bacterium]|nr:helix-turn-helix domain-containing protein [Acidimicrobiales bacterium]
MEVVMLRWPVESSRRAALAAAHAPRLLLVEGGSPAPEAEDCLEDWLRVPASEEDLRARAEALSLRARAHISSVPVLDPDGLLRFGSRWVPLPPVEVRLMGALLDRFGTVVHRDALAQAGWPEGAPGRNALDVHVLRLRRRLEPVSLAIRTIRSRGYLLERAASEHGQVHAREA